MSARLAERPTEEELDDLLEFAKDGGDHEWGWYVDDVPVLVAEIRRLRKELKEAEDAVPWDY